MKLKDLILNREYRIKFNTRKDLNEYFGKNKVQEMLRKNTMRIIDNYAYFNPKKVQADIEPYPYVYDIFSGKYRK